ncbi:MAG TPA: FkbM family methyltransferase [Beijerinckiaceae bacterium]|jgi:FkbM family methyltransferase
MDDERRFLADARGVIHVGANTGQERDLYAAHRLPVVWIEPIPEVFERLRRNIGGYPGQRAYQALIADADGRSYTFNVASNDGESSSIFDLADHRDVWPEVSYDRRITVEGITLASFVERHGIDIDAFDTLVLDTQGSELMVLRGAESILPRIGQVWTEAADFEAYRDGARLEDIGEFLSARGFREAHRAAFATRPQGGAYYDVLYRRER